MVPFKLLERVSDPETRERLVQIDVRGAERILVADVDSNSAISLQPRHINSLLRIWKWMVKERAPRFQYF